MSELSHPNMRGDAKKSSTKALKRKKRNRRQSAKRCHNKYYDEYLSELSKQSMNGSNDADYNDSLSDSSPQDKHRAMLESTTQHSNMYKDDRMSDLL
jgi:hypothetical protein